MNEQADEEFVTDSEEAEEEVETEEETEESAEQEPEEDTDEESDEESDEEPEPVSEVETVEFEGKEYSVPRDLKNAIMQNKDYTVKTQEVAEQRRELDADKLRFQQALELLTAHTGAYTELGVLDQQLAQYNEIDWNSWATQDPNAAQQAQIQLGGLREQRQQVLEQLQKLQADSQQKLATETSKIVEENRAKVANVVPNWSSETEKAVFDFGVQSGLTETQLAGTNYDPVLINILNKARLFDELQQKRSNKKTKKSAPVPHATRVIPKRTAQKGLHANLSVDEWVKRRNAQVSKRG